MTEREMNWENTVLSDRESAALLRGMPYHPSSDAGWMNFVRRHKLAQAKISYEQGKAEGIRTVAEWIKEYAIHGSNVQVGAMLEDMRAHSEFGIVLKEQGVE